MKNILLISLGIFYIFSSNVFGKDEQAKISKKFMPKLCPSVDLIIEKEHLDSESEFQAAPAFLPAFSLLNSHTQAPLFSNEPNETYLSGCNTWQGTVYLNGPVYVYTPVSDGNSIPASLDITNCEIIATTPQAKIVLNENSRFSATNSIFTSCVYQLGSWKGIEINSAPSFVSFSGCIIEFADIGVFVNQGYSYFEDTIFKFCIGGVYLYQSSADILNCVFDDIYYDCVHLEAYDINSSVDFDANKTVDLNDFSLMSKEWMKPLVKDPNDPNSFFHKTNLDSDPNLVDSKDLAILTDYWLSDMTIKETQRSKVNITNTLFTGCSMWAGYSNDRAVYVSGSAFIENAPIVCIKNSVAINSSKEAFGFYNKYVGAILENIAFGINYQDFNQGNPFSQGVSNKITLESDPFEFDYNVQIYFYYPIYCYWLKSDCPLINATQTPVCLDSALHFLGKSSVRGQMDNQTLDIGYHEFQDYYDEGYIPKGDVNHDSIVNLNDFYELSKHWLQSLDPNSLTDPNLLPSEPNNPDLNSDSIVDIQDLMIISDSLLETGTGNTGKGKFNIKFIQGDPNSLTGEVILHPLINMNDSPVLNYVVELNEKVIGKTLAMDNAENQVSFDVSSIDNGFYNLRVFALLDNGDYITSYPRTIKIKNNATIKTNEFFVPGKDLLIEANGFGNLEIYNYIYQDQEPNAIFAKTVLGKELVKIPASVFQTSCPSYKLIFTQDPNLAVLSSNVSDPSYKASPPPKNLPIEQLINRAYDPEAVKNDNIVGVVSVGSKDLMTQDLWQIWVKNIQRHCKQDQYVLFLPTYPLLANGQKIRQIECLSEGLTNFHSRMWIHFGHTARTLKGEVPRVATQVGGETFPTYTKTVLEKYQMTYPQFGNAYVPAMRFHEKSETLVDWIPCSAYRTRFAYIEGCESLGGIDKGYYEIPYVLWGILDGYGNLSNRKDLPTGGVCCIGYSSVIPAYDDRSALVQSYTWRKAFAESVGIRNSIGSAKRSATKQSLTQGKEMEDIVWCVGLNQDNAYMNYVNPSKNGPDDWDYLTEENWHLLD
ncbi:MAG: dockerin type I domain-containing protein [Candidatus Nanoarchaeia archaeon]